MMKNLSPELERIANENVKEEQGNRSLDLQEREIQRKETKDSADLQLAMKELNAKMEDIKARKQKSENDRYIATINKN